MYTLGVYLPIGSGGLAICRVRYDPSVNGGMGQLRRHNIGKIEWYCCRHAYLDETEDNGIVLCFLCRQLIHLADSWDIHRPNINYGPRCPFLKELRPCVSLNERRVSGPKQLPIFRVLILTLFRGDYS